MGWKTNTQRGPLIAAGVALAACFGIIAGTAYQEKQAAYANTSEGADAKRAEALKPVDPKTIAEADDAKKAIALTLREKWRDAWPSKHKDELRAMLRANADDEATLMGIDDKLPDLPSKEETGFSDDDMGACGMGTETDPTAVCAAWIYRRLKMLPDRAQDPDYLAQFERTTKLQKARLKADFASHRDIVLLRVESGRTENLYCLWVSGRVTIQSMGAEMVRDVDGKTHLVPPAHRELLAPYEFLQEEKK